MSSENPTNNPPAAGITGVETGVKDILGKGSRFLLLAAAVLLVWAGVAPLGQAVISHGQLVSDGNNKVLQHRTGGVVRAIHAKSGETLAEGQLILELDPDIDQAELTKLRTRMSLLQALRVRLDAEKEFSTGLETISIGDSATYEKLVEKVSLRGSRDKDMPEVEAALLEEQVREFEKGRRAVMAEVAALRQRSEALTQRREGLVARLAANQQQTALLSDQQESMRRLVAAGHVAKAQLWDIESRLLERLSEQASIQSELDSTAKEIEQTLSQIRSTELTDQRGTSEKLTDVIAEMAQIADQIRAAESALRQTEIRAPAAGTLVGFDVVTVGAVIRPAETFGQVVPSGVQLDFLGRVSPKDVIHVKVGTVAEVRLPALNARTFDPLRAEVVYIAADAKTDDRTGEKFFEVRARLDDGLPAGLELTPGMTGDAFLRGDDRTFAGYLLQPFNDGLARAFREY